MNKVVALSGKNISTRKCILETGSYEVYEDSTLLYTQEGLGVFGAVFREHSLDIRKIDSKDEHAAALDVCASESLHELEENKSLEAQLLKAVMLNSDNNEAYAIKDRIDSRDDLSSKEKGERKAPLVSVTTGDH